MCPHAERPKTVSRETGEKLQKLGWSCESRQGTVVAAVPIPVAASRTAAHVVPKDSSLPGRILPCNCGAGRISPLERRFPVTNLYPSARQLRSNRHRAARHVVADVFGRRRFSRASAVDISDEAAPSRLIEPRTRSGEIRRWTEQIGQPDAIRSRSAVTMWRSFFLAIGVYVCLLGVQALAVERAVLKARRGQRSRPRSGRSSRRIGPPGA